jgi:type II secretory pathway predicted ATPase ExeA
MIDKLQAHYGFTRMPFGRDLAPGMLHRHAAHNEAVARITWCITRTPDVEPAAWVTAAG